MPYSFQLYGARNFPPILEILLKLKELGYAQVEGFGGLYADEPQMAARLQENGLTMPTGHFGLEQLEDVAATTKIAEGLGIKTILCPFIPPEQRSTSDGPWQELATLLNKLGAAYNKAGFGFGWHNHDFEFTPTESGKMPLELILDGAPEIVWQHDVAWTVRAGQDPLQWIDRYADRIVSTHVKDIAPEGECADEDGWADVGHGIVDWPTIIAAIHAKTSCTSFVVEHDNPNDAVRVARRSIETLRNLKADQNG